VQDHFPQGQCHIAKEGATRLGQWGPIIDETRTDPPPNPPTRFRLARSSGTVTSNLISGVSRRVRRFYLP
jgi:hypothetical protein